MDTLRIWIIIGFCKTLLFCSNHVLPPISKNTDPIPIIFGALKSYDFSFQHHLIFVSIALSLFLALICLSYIINKNIIKFPTTAEAY